MSSFFYELIFIKRVYELLYLKYVIVGGGLILKIF